jgi:hypothetical protein
MKSKKLGFAIIAIISVLCAASLAFGRSGEYLVPVIITKADGNPIRGYIIFHEDEINRMGFWVVSPGRQKESRGRILWDSQRGKKDHSKLLEFHQIRFREGGNEVFITYRRGIEPIDGNNFFSPKGIRFTTDRLNPDVLPQFLGPGKIRWIERTGIPREIR